MGNSIKSSPPPFLQRKCSSYSAILKETLHAYIYQCFVHVALKGRMLFGTRSSPFSYSTKCNSFFLTQKTTLTLYSSEIFYIDLQSKKPSMQLWALCENLETDLESFADVASADFSV
ncbi:hypothetical protein FQA47_014001 [Oryzias melastigma]|uniref:Uncharacterized protein n=1 Tax=Oryzias melastigma TaxID=30732 RepID=A0A834CED6_ORYME|nr:hypothetical protein FQA47_014001 [Oryzias melastigma]